MFSVYICNTNQLKNYKTSGIESKNKKVEVILI